MRTQTSKPINLQRYGRPDAHIPNWLAILTSYPNTDDLKTCCLTGMLEENLLRQVIRYQQDIEDFLHPLGARIKSKPKGTEEIVLTVSY